MCECVSERVCVSVSADWSAATYELVFRPDARFKPAIGRQAPIEDWRILVSSLWRSCYSLGDRERAGSAFPHGDNADRRTAADAENDAAKGWEVAKTMRGCYCCIARHILVLRSGSGSVLDSPSGVSSLANALYPEIRGGSLPATLTIDAIVLVGVVISGS